MGKEFGLLFMDNGKGWKGWKGREEEKKQGKGNGNTRAAVGFHGPPLRDRRQHCWISRLHAGCTRLLACSIARLLDCPLPRLARERHSTPLHGTPRCGCFWDGYSHGYCWLVTVERVSNDTTTSES